MKKIYFITFALFLIICANKGFVKGIAKIVLKTTDFEKVSEEVRYSASECELDVIVEVIKPDNENYDKYEKLLEN